MNRQALKPLHEWASFHCGSAEWEAADPSLLGRQLRHMILIRAFEETVLDLASHELVHGPAHSAVGQEGGAVGCLMGLERGDLITGSHRAHHQFLAKCLAAIDAPVDQALAQPFAADVEDLLNRTLAEIMGLKIGFCRGRGGSMHLLHDEFGVMGTNAIVGGGVPSAVGAAWALKEKKTDNVVVAHLGDGAANIGAVPEAMNLAALWNLPVIFFIENNQYAVATSVAESTRETRLSSRGVAFGIPSYTVDGMDPLAVHLLTQNVLKGPRNGEGPVVIEANVYRYFHQNGGLPGSAFKYRSKAEEKDWRTRDPIERVASFLIEKGLSSEEEVQAYEKACRNLMDEITQGLTEQVDGKRSIRDSLWPDPANKDFGLRGDLSELAEYSSQERETSNTALKEGKFVSSVAQVMHRRMTQDDSIVIMGEDIHQLGGGTNGATKGLVDDFPDRVIATPISEESFAGFALGMALEGHYRPVIEFMYADFTLVAADQVFNQIAKARHMFGGDKQVPIVLRTKFAAGTGYGSQHSMDPAGLFANWPGWRIVAPSTAYDYVGLINAAIACNDPVLVIEHVDFYNKTDRLPMDNLDYIIPLGNAKVVREGSACTVLTYLGMIEPCIQLAEEMSIDAEVIDLRSLDRAGLDWETIGDSIRKTNAVIVAEQGSLTASYGALLTDEIQRRFFDWLDAPVLRIHGSESSPSVSKVLEQAALAGPHEIRAGYRAIMREKGILTA